MNGLLVAEQALNGLQLGTMLFLMASGLTLVFGIMNLVNLAHGSLYMVGAYIAATAFQASGSLGLAIVCAVVGAAIVGMVVELGILRAFYRRDHLDQVLATFGMILFFNEITRIIWGPQAYFLALPPGLDGSVELIPGAPYPVFRLVIIATGIVVALGLYLLIGRTRLGMLIRAGASNRTMVQALGANVGLLYTLVFGLGAGLAGLAGAMAGPLLAVQAGMGDTVLILTLVVIVVGGIGSIRGAFIAALLIGLVDTFGRMLLPASLAEMAVYILMAIVLYTRPQGLFPAHG